MAHDALAFVDALGLQYLDVLGFSLGGFVAQELTLIRPKLVRRLVLAGTGPEGGQAMHGYTPAVREDALLDEPTGDALVGLFFPPIQASVERGWEFISSASSPGPRTATSW